VWFLPIMGVIYTLNSSILCYIFKYLLLSVLRRSSRRGNHKSPVTKKYSSLYGYSDHAAHRQYQVYILWYISDSHEGISLSLMPRFPSRLFYFDPGLFGYPWPRSAPSNDSGLGSGSRRESSVCSSVVAGLPLEPSTNIP